MPKLTNTGTVQPLGVPGVLGAIEPSQTRVIAQADWDRVKDKPVLRHWVAAGLIVADAVVEPLDSSTDVVEPIAGSGSHKKKANT